MALNIVGVLDPATWTLPSAPLCGLRTDLPRRQRRHQFLDAGTDVRNRFEDGFAEVRVLICRECGRDRAVPMEAT